MSGPEVAVKNFLASKNITGELIFTMTGGSHCYNLNLENSDFDFLGVYVAHTDDFVGLPDEKPIPAVASTSPDIQLYEVGRFCELIQSGNPMIMQMLFTNQLYWCTPEFEELRKKRNVLLSKATVNAYIGYVRNELKQALGKEKFEQAKYYYHAYRLIFELERLIKNEAPHIQISGEEREFLLKIRRKDVEMNKIRTEINNRLEAIEGAKPWDAVIQPNLKAGTEGYTILRDWLISIRKKYWKQ